MICALRSYLNSPVYWKYLLISHSRAQGNFREDLTTFYLGKNPFILEHSKEHTSNYISIFRGIPNQKTLIKEYENNLYTKINLILMAGCLLI